MLAKKTVRNQITIPKALMRELPDTNYFEVFLRNGEIVLRPVSQDHGQGRLTQVRAKVKALGFTEKDVDDAIRWARER